MKTILSSAALLALSLGVYAFAANGSSQKIGGRLEITVDYERQSGRGSNQYAVWIEDTEGNHVKTLYVTRFTGEGGYEPRPDCTPTWVEKSGVESLNKEQIDAFTGATPQSGKHVYTWDGTDSSGQKVASGDYVFVVEATYLGNNIVMFRGDFATGARETEIECAPRFNSDEKQNRDMIKSVSARYIP